MLAALAAAASVAFAPNVFATRPYHGPNYYDRDGDGLPDDSDPCPDNSDPTCSGQDCGTATTTGKGRSWIGRTCRFEYTGVWCTNGTRQTSYADCPPVRIGSNAGTGGGGGGSGGKGGGSDQSSGNDGQDSPDTSNRTPTPGDDVNADRNVVQQCALELGAKSNVFLEVADERVSVEYSYPSVFEQGPEESVARLVLGATQLQDGKPHIELSYDLISRDADLKGNSYWEEFAETLIHEYYHAYDMLECGCEDPHKALKKSPERYEDYTNDRAEPEAKALASCLPD